MLRSNHASRVVPRGSGIWQTVGALHSSQYVTTQRCAVWSSSISSSDSEKLGARVEEVKEDIGLGWNWFWSYLLTRLQQLKCFKIKIQIHLNVFV
jgi:hypothetical protein